MVRDSMNLIRDEIKKFSAGNVCIVGIGNRMQGDDGAGSVLIDRISGQISANCLDAGVAPENFLEKIVRCSPKTVMLVDAVDFKGEPGEICVLDCERILEGGISTHALSLQMACDYLKKRMSSVRVILIGIKPEQIGFGQGLSHAVAEAVETLTVILKDQFPGSK